MGPGEAVAAPGEAQAVGAGHDPGDNYLLAMVAASQARYLATGDKSDLLAL